MIFEKKTGQPEPSLLTSSLSCDTDIMDAGITEAKGAGILTVVSAGNYGEDASNYSPANAKDAITVAAVKNDKTLDKTSNYGDVIDYAAYGTLEVGGLNGEIGVSDGTSVSAAIVSGVAADVIADGNHDYASAVKALDALAEDLGDKKCGRGFLGNMDVKSEDSTEEGKKDEATVVKSELLTCDWKSLSEEELNALIEQATYIDAKRFLDDLSEEEKEQVLSIKDCYYKREVTSVVSDVDTETGTIKESKRFHGTILEYLYSDYFKDYVVQYSASGTGANYFDMVNTGKTKYKLSNASGAANVSSTGDATSSFTITGDDGGGLKFEDMKIEGGKSSDNGFFVVIEGVKADKSGTHKLTAGYTASKDNCKGQHTKRESTGAPIEAVNDSCAQTISVKLRYSDADEQCASCTDDGAMGTCARTYTLNVDNAGKTWGDWANNGNAKAGTCSVKGYQPQKRTQTCDACGDVTNTKTQDVDLGYAAHTFNTTAFVDYNDQQHIKYCDNYAACSQVNPGGYSLENHTYDESNYTMLQKETCYQKGDYITPCLICGHLKHNRPDELPHNDGLDAAGLGDNPVWIMEPNNGFPEGHRYTHCTNGCDRIVRSEYYVQVTKDDDSIASVTGANGFYAVATPKLGRFANQGGNWRNADTVTLTANPLIGHHFVRYTSSWMSGNSPDKELRFTMPNSAISIHADGAINISTLVVNPNFKTNSYKASCDAYWEGSSDPQSFGPKNWHSTKDIPVPTRVGYDFSGWTFSSDHPNDGPGVMSTLTAAALFTYGSDWAAESTDTITANWTPRNDTKYVIRHWKQNLDYSLGDDKNKYDDIMDDYEKYYTLDETENLQGQSDKVLVFKEIARNYPGFHFAGGKANVNDGPFIQVTQAKIHPDGITVIDLFYARNRYTVNTSHDGFGEVYSESEGRGGSEEKKKGSNWFQYGDDVTVSYEPYDGWCTKYITVDGTKIEGEKDRKNLPQLLPGQWY